MQTTKYLLAAGVLAAVILPLQVQGGPDSEEQAKMRAALRRALEQPNTPQSQPQPAAVAQPAAAPAPATAEQTPAAPPPQPTPVAPPPAAATVVVPASQPGFEAVPPPTNADDLARARELMRQKIKEPQSAPATTPAPVTPTPVVAVAPPAAPTPAAVPAASPAPAPKSAPVFTPVAASGGYKPIETPGSPLSSSKQTRLADLLARYRADSITAQEYHAQRAAIIAEP